MEGPEKKSVINPAVAFQTVLAILGMNGKESASVELAAHVIETRIFPALRALDPEVRRAATRVTAGAKGFHLLTELCFCGYSLELVRYFVEECDADVHAMSDSLAEETALVAAMSRINSVGTAHDAIIAYLISRGASIDALHMPGKWTALMRACRLRCNTTIISRMIHYGADVNAKDKRGRTPLQKATRNKKHGPAMMDVLVRAGADVDGMLVLNYIYDHLDAMSEVVIHAALWRGHCVLPTRLSLTHTKRPAIWRMYMHRMGSTPFISGGNDDTLLHVAARSQPTMLPVLMHRGCMLNPLVRNRHGELARDVAPDNQAKALLDAYATWTPVRAKTRWYGPLFEERALCFAMVCKRWRTEGVRTMPRDVIYKVLEWVARVGFYSS